MANVRISRRKSLGMSVRRRFELPAGASVPRKRVYHCHILMLEDDGGMMRPYYDVVV
jgi:FtsP/CotA-like multicopper oxidase with cupredoxin domain